MYTKAHSMLAQSGFGAVMAASSSSGVFIVGKQIVNFKQELKIKTKNKKRKRKNDPKLLRMLLFGQHKDENLSHEL